MEKMVTDLADKTSISNLELDLLKMRVQQLYEELLKLPEPTQDISDEEFLEVPISEPDVKEVRMEETMTSAQKPEPSTQEYEESIEPVEHIEAPGIDDETPDPEVVPEPMEKKKPHEVLADRFKDKQQFRNEHLIKGQAMKDLSSKYDEQPLSDIALGIGLNERFQFIKELFQGNPTDFKETIDYLNKVTSEEEAMTYIKNHYKWDMEDKLVIRLLHLTRRKLKMDING